MIENGVRRTSPVYRGLHASAAPFTEPLPRPPAVRHELSFERGSLGPVRRLVAARAAEAGLLDTRANDLVLAVNEIATNSVRHAGGRGTLRVWLGKQWLVCEVEDYGSIDDPLAGREEPAPDESRGRGLWIANQVCELVQVRTLPTGSVVRLHMRRTD